MAGWTVIHRGALAPAEPSRAAQCPLRNGNYGRRALYADAQPVAVLNVELQPAPAGRPPMRQLTDPRHTRREAIGLIGGGALAFGAMPALAAPGTGGDEVLN